MLMRGVCISQYWLHPCPLPRSPETENRQIIRVLQNRKVEAFIPNVTEVLESLPALSLRGCMHEYLPAYMGFGDRFPSRIEVLRCMSLTPCSIYNGRKHHIFSAIARLRILESGVSVSEFRTNHTSLSMESSSLIQRRNCMSIALLGLKVIYLYTSLGL